MLLYFLKLFESCLTYCICYCFWLTVRGWASRSAKIEVTWLKLTRVSSGQSLMIGLMWLPEVSEERSHMDSFIPLVDWTPHSSLYAQGMASLQLQGGYVVHADAPTGSLATVFKTSDGSARIVLQCYYSKSSPQWIWMQGSAWIWFVGVAFQ